MPDAPLAMSPCPVREPSEVVHGWLVSTRVSTALLRLRDVSPLAKVLVRAPEGGQVARAMDVPVGRARRAADGVLTVGSAPGEWTLLGPVGSAAETTARLRDRAGTEFISVYDITHGRGLLRLSGSSAPLVLSKLCPIDLADHITPNGSAFRSSVARLATEVVRDDRAGERSYLMHCERSSAQYLQEALVDAGAEYDIALDGFGDG